MDTVAKIIAMYRGASRCVVSLENPPYMRLAIETIGQGPRGYPALSVAHYFEQNGDLMQDPEVMLELVPQPDGTVAYEPYAFQRASPPMYQEVYAAESDTVLHENRVLKDQLTAFITMWDRNLEAQGFLRAATAQLPKAELQTSEEQEIDHRVPRPGDGLRRPRY